MDIFYQQTPQGSRGSTNQGQPNEYEKPKTDMSENKQLVLSNVRLSFPALFTAKAVNDGEPRYSANFLLHKEKDAKLIASIKGAIDALIKSDLEGKKLPAEKVCLRDGDDKEYDGYQGHFYLAAANKKRPQVVDRDNAPLVESDDKPVAGDYVDAVVRLWAQDNKFGKRINASLEVVRFRKEGEHFGAPKVDVNEVLPDLAEDDDYEV